MNEPTMRFNGWLALIIVSLILLIMALLVHTKPARAHDHHRPELNGWMKSLHSKGKAWCCNGDDHDPIDDWETKEGSYRVKFQGIWYDVPDEAVVEDPNKAGDALLWMSKGYGGFAVRCFLPGAMT